MKNIILLLAVLFMSSGCAGQSWYTGDYQTYGELGVAHYQGDSARIVSQADNIRQIVAEAEPETQTEKTLLAVIGIMAEQNLEPQPFTLAPPTTGMDVLEGAVGVVPNLVTGVTSVRLAKALMDTVGGISFDTNGGDLELTDALNTTRTDLVGADNVVTNPGRDSSVSTPTTDNTNDSTNM